MRDLKLFLCYRREDSAGYAGRLFDHLSAHFPKRVFRDVDSIAAGADFVHELEKSIKSSDVVVALIGRQWLATDSSAQRRIDDPGDFVRVELETALASGIRIIPALVGGAAIPAVGDLPDSLQAMTRRQAIELGDATFARDVERLVKELKEIGSLVAKERRERAAAEKGRLKQEEVLRRRQLREQARLAADARDSKLGRLSFGGAARFWRAAVIRFPALGRPVLVTVIMVALVLLFGLTALLFSYAQITQIVSTMLRDGAAPKVTRVYALPDTLRVGASSSPEEVAAAARERGYDEDRRNPDGYFELGRDRIAIYPGSESPPGMQPTLLKFSAGKLAQVISLKDNTGRDQYSIEPLMVTNLAGGNRRFIPFGEIPRVLVEAVISAEDPNFFRLFLVEIWRFFSSSGLKTTGDAKEDAGDDRPRVPLTLALARMLLPPNKPGLHNGFNDALTAIQLVRKLPREKIFELYANQVYLGGSGVFIRGFADGSQYYFGKSITQINLPEAALLAGIISRPDYYFPFQHPERARERRNVVLGFMHENGFISSRDYELAVESPITLTRRGQDAGAPYFADMISDQLRSRFTNMDLLHGSNRVYTSLDTVLQRAAVDAVRATLGKIDHQIASDPRWEDYPATEVALVALEPRTGEVRALVGGRKYDVGAVEGKYEVPKNRSLENVLPGPMFFPFDYAAAISAARSGDPIPSSAISAAQKAGYEAVASLANRCGLYHDAKPLQALAMGNERTSPLSVAAAYTVFANLGTCVQPALVLSVRDDKNNLVFKYEPAQEAVLESSSASRLLQLLQTGVTEARAIRVNREDSSAPALVLSGKSRDAWAVGFTSRLLAVVWLGYDDREFPLDSSVSATRVWTDFMSRATKLPRYAETGAGAPSTTARAGGTSVPRRRRSQK